MLTLEILPAIEKPQLPKDVFVLTCRAMFGDADGYEDVKVGQFSHSNEDQEKLEEAIRCCERMDKKYPHGMGGRGSFDDVEGFSKWFLDGDKWPYDPFTDYDIIASFDSYKVTYFDSESIEHPVNFTIS